MSLQSRSIVRVTLFGYSSLNPYLLLYKDALERQGVTVYLERRFSLFWLVTKGRSCDVVHLHWIKTAYESYWWIPFKWARSFVNHHVFRAIRGTLRMADFSVAIFLAKLQGKSIVYTVHNLGSHESKESWPFVILRRMAHQIVLFLADRIHAHNHYTRELLETTYGRKYGVVVVPHGNFIDYYPNQISRMGACQRLGLPSDAFVYLFLGLIRPYKGVEELIAAFEKLEPSTDRLLIVGRAFNGSYVEKISGLSGNNPAISLLPGHVPDEAIQLYMNACDVCVFPYRDVTTSGAAVLALSFGRPVIAPAIASFPEIITPETGILYDSSEPDALAWALQQARERDWSRSAILDYAHRFDWDRLGPQLADLYRVEPGRQCYKD